MSMHVYAAGTGVPKTILPSLKISDLRYPDTFQTRSGQHHRKQRLEHEHGGTTCSLNMTEPPQKKDICG